MGIQSRFNGSDSQATDPGPKATKMAAIAPIIRRMSSTAGFASKGDPKTWHQYLSPFQEEKFAHMFHIWFLPYNVNVLESHNIPDWIERLRVYSGQETDSQAHNRIHDMFDVFWEALVDQHHMERKEDNKPKTWEEARKAKPADWYTSATVSLTTWLNMWGGLCHNARGFAYFPSWVRAIPDIFFELMDQDNDDEINAEELKNFFVSFLGMKDHEGMGESVKDIYYEMTMHGETTLNRYQYQQVFANFLLCRTKVGPGHLIYGPMEDQDIIDRIQASLNIT